MLLLRVGLNAPHRPPDIRNCGSLVNGLEILMDDYPFGNHPVGRKQSALSSPQVILNEFENIGSPDIRPTPAETRYREDRMYIVEIRQDGDGLVGPMADIRTWL